MKHHWSAAALAVVLGAAAPAHAAAPHYSFVEAAWLTGEKTDAAPGAGDTDGARAAVSLSLQRWLNFTAEYDFREFGSADVRFGSAGFGVHSLQPNFQVLAAVTYEWLDTNPPAPFPGNREDGYGVLFGGRIPIGLFELQLDYKYVDYGDLSTGARLDDARYRATGTVRLTDVLSFAAAYHTYEDFALDEFTLGLRLNFDTQHDVRR